ncbi:hypothetical protein ORI20_13810 [Mycobacterium sp. CVI_P3]|uniref:Uncharacterized protein n=1 Tax=Mycobacterium pinniadriaticum TaxID=2994102 RepID=A0ABT3SF82_9MYCO|nr:hypothetical protein [Mycobacterium pinniadriaticum]MCX2931355.1 hypothetical protein [Mycobacterium pinniadriaticum]MCX2937779.1 hypothetical protein [Mycobacterium pinniadriaticum]
MTAALDVRPDPHLTPVPMRPADAAIAMLEAHAQMMDMAYSLAVKMCNTKLVPTRFFRKPEDATAAILYGAELGLNPIQSLQRVIPIHGMPTLEALTMVALLHARGYTIKTITESETVAEVHGWKPGRSPDSDQPDATCAYTIERAIRARYVPQPATPDSKMRPEVDSDWVTVTKSGDDWSKTSVVGNMQYITDPTSMLLAKARTKVCKEIAPEVLLGIASSTEDQRDSRFDDDEPARATAERVQGSDEPITVDEVDVNEPTSPPASRLADKIKPAPDPQEPTAEPDESDPEPAPESQGDVPPPPEPESMPEPATSPPKATAKTKTGQDKPTMTAMRRSLEGRLFKLLGQLKVTDREDRIHLYRATLERPDVNSTDDLDDVEVTRVADQLYRWQKDGVADDEIREILNAATYAEENNTADSDQTQEQS